MNDADGERTREDAALAMLSPEPPRASEAVPPVRVEPTADRRGQLAGKPAVRRATQPPVRWREGCAVLLIVALCDATIYHGQGYAGWAFFFVLAPLLLMIACWRPRVGLGLVVVGVMLAVLAAKSLWCGSILLTVSGLGLVVAFAMCLCGMRPHVLEAIVFASQTVLAGYEGVILYWRSASRAGPPLSRVAWLNVALPVVTAAMFAVIFLLANPDLLSWFGENVDWFLRNVRQGILNRAPAPLQVLFWLAVAWVTVGLIRPVFRASTREGAARGEPAGKDASAPAYLYSAFFNTMVSVIVLFAIYLCFEFATLWFREFPPGFHYSGYAHEGAAWLTLALALATVILSLVFRGPILRDPRLATLRRLAWLWSAENLVLAVAVYNRLFIYVGFNGMTRMRILGLFGMSAVVVGFLLVLWKIARDRDFVWLLRRHLWTLAIAVYLFSLTPLDTIVCRYNVQRILAGDPAPCVQISVHPINSEGILLLEPLLGCENERIREGVRALLAEHHRRAEASAHQRREAGWTAYQIADAAALSALRGSAGKWREYALQQQLREAALREFHDYAYQWY